MRRATPLLLGILAATPCPAQPHPQPHAGTPVRPGPPGDPVWPPGPVLRPAELPPLRFLEALRALRDTPRGVRVDFMPPDWVGREDVPALLALIRSAEPVALTCAVIAAHAPPPDARSTLGREAMRLIDAYRRGSFPLSCSNLAGPGDPDAVERWWAEGGARR